MTKQTTTDPSWLAEFGDLSYREATNPKGLTTDERSRLAALQQIIGILGPDLVLEQVTDAMQTHFPVRSDNKTRDYVAAASRSVLPTLFSHYLRNFGDQVPLQAVLDSAVEHPQGALPLFELESDGLIAVNAIPGIDVVYDSVRLSSGKKLMVLRTILETKTLSVAPGAEGKLEIKLTKDAD